MTLGYKDKVLENDFDYRQYFTRRCIKFYPLHWLCILAIMPLVFLSFSWQDIPILFLNAALLQTWIPIDSVYFSFNAVSWYLADTMFFTIVFPFIFRGIKRTPAIGRLMIASALTIVYIIVSMLIPADMYHAILYISPYIRLMDFVFGIFLAIVYLKLKENLQLKLNNAMCQIRIIVLILLLVLESCLLSENATLFAPVYWIPIAALIILASLSEQHDWEGQILPNQWLQRLGKLCFTIFMVHQIILRYTTVVFKILHFENEIVFVALTLITTIVVSIVVDKYMIKPITQWLTKRNQQSMIVRS